MLILLRMHLPSIKPLIRTDTSGEEETSRLPRVALSLNQGLGANQNWGSHVVDDVIGEFAGTDLGRAFHQAMEVVSDGFLFDGTFQPSFNQVGGFAPAQIAKHHPPG